MAKVNGIGISDYTPTKQRHFREILNTHLIINEQIFKKHSSWNRIDPYYWYFDIYAGDGKPNNNLGSPLIFLNLAKNKQLKVKAIFIEKVKKNFKKLKVNTIDYVFKNAQLFLHYGDNKNILPEYFIPSVNYRYGLLYSDPNGISDFEILSKISNYPCYNRLDILINVPSAAIKKARCSPLCKNHNKNLIEYIKTINKQYWLIREPYLSNNNGKKINDRSGSWQWTFLIGSNWNNFPRFKKLGFHEINSDRGQEILNKLTYTNEELEKMNG